MSDSHWLDGQPTPPPAEQVAPVRPTTPVGAVAARLGDVAPAWRRVTAPPLDAPRSTPAIELLGRDRAQGVEAIREGWLLHRGAARIVHDASPDLSLLMGDWCYAAGLCSITDHGTLDDVATLARLVADVSVGVDRSVEELEPRWDEALESLRD
jgi:hypothetical protein